MAHKNVPLWVLNALQRKLDNAEVNEPRNGCYEWHVDQETCGRFDCTVEIWVGRIDADTFDKNGRDPNVAPITVDDLSIHQM